MLNYQSRIKITRIFSIISAVLLLFWWPLSHLLYSDWYHSITGFAPGSYQQPMVTVIGVCGFLPVMILVIAAIDPVKYRLNILAMIVFSFLLFAMYMYLVLTGLFPEREIINIVICFTMPLIYSAITPWR